MRAASGAEGGSSERSTKREEPRDSFVKRRTSFAFKIINSPPTEKGNSQWGKYSHSYDSPSCLLCEGGEVDWVSGVREGIGRCPLPRHGSVMGRARQRTKRLILDGSIDCESD